VGDSNPRVGAGCQRRRDSRHDLQRNMVSCQPLGLLGQSPEDQRIAAFESHDDLAFSSALHQFPVDFRLTAESLARMPSQAYQFGTAAGMTQDLRIHQVVVQDAVRTLQTLDTAQRDQRRVAGPRADQIHFAMRGGC
jgi:hypothetical protein